MPGRGWNRDQGDVYPYVLDPYTGEILRPSPEARPQVTLLDYETMAQRYNPRENIGRCADDSVPWCEEVNVNAYDSVDVNRALRNMFKYIEPNPRAILTIKGLCDDPATIDYMENEYGIDSDLICDNEHDCSESINLELLCPNGQDAPSDILNPLKVLCENGINCNYPERCISIDTSISDEVCNPLSGDESLCNDSGCLYIPPIGNRDDRPDYHWPCIIYSEECKDNSDCNHIMIQLSNELSMTNDITQSTFKQCRDNNECKNLMDCSLSTISTNKWDIHGQCSIQEGCIDGSSSISWPCLTIDNENYYRCNDVESPVIFDQSNCYCSGINDYNGEGMGYESIRELSEDTRNTMLGIFPNLTIADEETNVRNLISYNTLDYGWDELNDADRTYINTYYDTMDNIGDSVNTPGTLEFNRWKQRADNPVNEYNDNLQLLKYIQENRPICSSTDENGVPFCYTESDVCIDGVPSEKERGYDTSYEACNYLSLNRINTDNRYLPGQYNWNDNLDEPGGYWNHYFINDYGIITKCNNKEIAINNKCESCGGQIGCELSDVNSSCTHLGSFIFGKECIESEDYIMSGYYPIPEPWRRYDDQFTTSKKCVCAGVDMGGRDWTNLGVGDADSINNATTFLKEVGMYGDDSQHPENLITVRDDVAFTGHGYTKFNLLSDYDLERLIRGLNLPFSSDRKTNIDILATLPLKMDEVNGSMIWGGEGGNTVVERDHPLWEILFPFMQEVIELQTPLCADSQWGRVCYTEPGSCSDGWIGEVVTEGQINNLIGPNGLYEISWEACMYGGSDQSLPDPLPSLPLRRLPDPEHLLEQVAEGQYWGYPSTRTRNDLGYWTEQNVIDRKSIAEDIISSGGNLFHPDYPHGIGHISYDSQIWVPGIVLTREAIDNEGRQKEVTPELDRALWYMGDERLQNWIPNPNHPNHRRTYTPSGLGRVHMGVEYDLRDEATWIDYFIPLYNGFKNNCPEIGFGEEFCDDTHITMETSTLFVPPSNWKKTNSEISNYRASAARVPPGNLTTPREGGADAEGTRWEQAQPAYETDWRPLTILHEHNGICGSPKETAQNICMQNNILYNACPDAPYCAATGEEGEAGDGLPVPPSWEYFWDPAAADGYWGRMVGVAVDSGGITGVVNPVSEWGWAASSESAPVWMDEANKYDWGCGGPIWLSDDMYNETVLNNWQRLQGQGRPTGPGRAAYTRFGGDHNREQDGYINLGWLEDTLWPPQTSSDPSSAPLNGTWRGQSAVCAAAVREACPGTHRTARQCEKCVLDMTGMRRRATRSNWRTGESESDLAIRDWHPDEGWGGAESGVWEELAPEIASSDSTALIQATVDCPTWEQVTEVCTAFGVEAEAGARPHWRLYDHISQQQVPSLDNCGTKNSLTRIRPEGPGVRTGQGQLHWADFHGAVQAANQAERCAREGGAACASSMARLMTQAAAPAVADGVRSSSEKWTEQAGTDEAMLHILNARGTIPSSEMDVDVADLRAIAGDVLERHRLGGSLTPHWTHWFPDGYRGGSEMESMFVQMEDVMAAIPEDTKEASREAEENYNNAISDMRRISRNCSGGKYSRGRGCTCRYNDDCESGICDNSGTLIDGGIYLNNPGDAACAPFVE